MSRLPTLSAFTLNDGNLPLKEKASAVVFSEYLAAVKFAVAQVKSQVRYRGLNRGGGWLRDPLEVPQNLQRASLRSTRINGVRQDFARRSSANPRLFAVQRRIVFLLLAKVDSEASEVSKGE